MSSPFHIVPFGTLGHGKPRAHELHLVVGMPGHGKSVYIINFLHEWRRRALGHSFAIDLEAQEPVGTDYIGRWADAWCRFPPDELAPETRLLVCDEVWKYVSAKKSDHPLMRELAAVHRHRQVMLVWGTQRPMQIHRDVWAMARRVVIFRTIDASDHKRLLELGGMERRHIEVIARLPPGFAAVWDAHDVGVRLPWVPAWGS